MGRVRAYYLTGRDRDGVKIVPYLGPCSTEEPGELFIAPREKQVPAGLSKKVAEHGLVLKRFDMNRALTRKGEEVRDYLKAYAEEVLKDAGVEINLDSLFAVVEPNGEAPNKQPQRPLIEQIST